MELTIHYFMAEAKFANGEYDDAQKTFAFIAEEEHESDTAFTSYIRLAQICLTKNDFSKANEWISRALQDFNFDEKVKRGSVEKVRR